MTTARTFGALYPEKAVSRAAALFSDLAIYRFCLAVAAFDFFDVFDLLEGSNLVKYSYALVVLAIIAVYFLRWRKIGVSVAPIIFLLFFIVTGSAFAIRFFIFDERNSYVSAFIAPLAFSTALFIPANSIMLDARKVVRDLTILFSIGTVLYLAEAVVRPLELINRFGLNEVSILKSMTCVLAICLAILIGRKTLAIVLAAVTLVALGLRPSSTLVLGLICSVPLALAFRRRVLGYRPISVLLGRLLTMGILALAVSTPWLLYLYFDDLASIILEFESWLKGGVIGGISNTSFRLAVLKFAFATFDDGSFWYGSALSGNLTVPLGQHQSWQWWFLLDQSGEAPIHSDFVIVLCLMGIIGYAAFSAAFYFILRARFRELSRRDIYGNRVVLQAISIIACAALLIYSSTEPYLAFFSHTNTVWMLLLISEMARKSKVVG